MKKIFYYAMLVIGILSFVAFTYQLFTGGSKDVFYLFFMSIISLLMGLMVEPGTTEEQKSKLYGALIGIMSLIVIIVILSLQSCTTTGYGCHGRSKCMTRVQ